MFFKGRKIFFYFYFPGVLVTLWWQAQTLEPRSALFQLSFPADAAILMHLALRIGVGTIQDNICKAQCQTSIKHLLHVSVCFIILSLGGHV